jgi:hypothetical protein
VQTIADEDVESFRMPDVVARERKYGTLSTINPTVEVVAENIELGGRRSSHATARQ